MSTVIRIDISPSVSKWARRAAVFGLPLVAAIVAGVAVGVPKKFVAGAKLTAADLNANFDDIDGRLATLETNGADLDHRVTDLEGQKTRISVQGYAAGAIPNQTFTKVKYATEEYDDLGEFDPATSTFTASVAGDYEFCSAAYITVPAGSVATFEIDLFIDGVRDNPSFAVMPHGTTATAGAGCQTVRLAAGAKVDLRLWQPSGASASFVSDGFWDYLRINRL